MQQGLDTTEQPASVARGSHSRSTPANMTNSRNHAETSNHVSNHQSPVRLRPAWSLERSWVESLYDRVGRPRLTIVLWDGTAIGDKQSPVGQIVVGSPSVLRRLLWSPNLAFGECYSEGTLQVVGELLAVLVEINRGLSLVRDRRSGRAKRFTSYTHSLAKSKSSVHHHYDLGNEFYRLWLDERLVYTCAYYPHPTATLSQAQEAKLDYVCRKLRLQPGERVAEAGCGWGALAMHMARHYGVSVKAYNLSTEQIQYARDWAQREGLSDKVQFVQDDYRHLTGEFDAFVSVGMLEHVGPQNYRGMGQLMNRVLNPVGRGLIHSIGRNVARDLDPWTEKYIFPGAHPPSLREMMDLFEEDGFSVLDVENLRLHYAKTCADWLANFDQVADRVGQMFDERFVRMWRLYLAASSAAFVNGDLQLFQIVFTREKNNSLPITRADWYSQPLSGQTPTA